MLQRMAREYTVPMAFSEVAPQGPDQSEDLPENLATMGGADAVF